MNKNLFVKKYMFATTYAKCKHTHKVIKIISKFYEILSHILNMNNCTIPITIEKFDSCDFTKNI
jgi:hypothetical protein